MFAVALISTRSKRNCLEKLWTHQYSRRRARPSPTRACSSLPALVDANGSCSMRPLARATAANSCFGTENSSGPRAPPGPVEVGDVKGGGGFRLPPPDRQHVEVRATVGRRRSADDCRRTATNLGPFCQNTFKNKYHFSVVLH